MSIRDVQGVPVVILVMGVSGAGKTTIGQLLAQELGWRFYDADHFHPQANIDKMQQGIPLTDDDRWPWLQALRDCIERCLTTGEGAVLVCSALKQTYRERLIGEDEAGVKLVYLKGSYDLLYTRLTERQGHFMPAGLLASQLATLEEPDTGITVDVGCPPAKVVEAIRQALGL